MRAQARTDHARALAPDELRAAAAEGLASLLSRALTDDTDDDAWGLLGRVVCGVDFL